jgi:hypothetical protein
LRAANIIKRNPLRGRGTVVPMKIGTGWVILSPVDLRLSPAYLLFISLRCWVAVIIHSGAERRDE